MPYQWVDPELFLEYEGVAVYHCYDDGETINAYWYTTDVTDCDLEYPNSDSAQFDVRELPNLSLDADDPKNHTTIIQTAIIEGLITGEPEVKVEPPAPVVKIEVIGVVAYVVEQLPGIEVEIIDRDMDEESGCNADNSQTPDLETLMHWVDEGICEAIDGCIVEPDGVCEHNCKSWLLELGLI